MEQNDLYDFRVYTATIIEDRVWNETHVSGGGGSSIPYGGLHIDEVRSRNVLRQKVWLRDDVDGQEFETDLTTTKLSCRVGHKLTYVHAKARRKNGDKHEKLLAIYNRNTGQTYKNQQDINSVISDAVSFSMLTLLLWPVMTVVWAIILSEKHPGLSVFFGMIPSLIISYFRHRKPRKLMDRLLQEKLAETPAQNPAEETIRVTALAT